MYLDCVKQDYSDKPKERQQEYIDRDKRNLASIVQLRIASDISNIVDRWYKLDDIGYISDEEKFLYLLKEAEELYSFSYYTGTISIIGIAAEEYCRYLMQKSHLTDVDEQRARINILYKNHVIDKKSSSAFHTIRLLRNKCVHYTTDFKNFSENQLEHSAYEMICSFKLCIKPLASSPVNYCDLSKKTLALKETSFREFIYKSRNLYKKESGLDLQIDPTVKRMIFTFRYYVAEIDIDTDQFKEMTLLDLDKNYTPVIIDLTLCQAQQIQASKLQEGNIITATLLSNVSSMGHTEEWLLLDILDVYNQIIELSELEHYMQLISK